MKTSPPNDSLHLASRHRSTAALTLIEVLAIVAVVAILAFLIIPGQRSQRASSTKNKCVNNLKQMGIAYRLWSGDCGDRYQMKVAAIAGGSRESIENGDVAQNYRVMSNELNDAKILVCPADVERRVAASFLELQSGNLSYFVGIDASETSPQGLLSGDRNITNGTPVVNNFLELTTNHPAGWTEKIHKGQGQVGLADGSVQQFSSSLLQKQIAQTGEVTNRLVLP